MTGASSSRSCRLFCDIRVPDEPQAAIVTGNALPSRSSSLKKPLFYSLPPAGHKIPLRLSLGCFGNRSQEHCERAIEGITRYLGIRNVFYLSSGRAALWLYLKALSVFRRERNEVIVPAYTCPSVVSAVLKAGLTPVLCDNNLEDLGYDLQALESKLGHKTLAAIVVHLYGVPVDVAAVQELCRNHGASLVEDAAQAFGNSFPDEQDVKLGLKGDAGFYSFGRGKPISILHGGLLAVASDEVGHEARRIMRELNANTANVRYGLSLGTYALFSNPRLYWIPQMIPFLNLGGTVFEPEFATSRGLHAAAAVLGTMLSGLEKEKEIRGMNAKWYADNLTAGCIRHIGSRGEYPYLRYPLMIVDTGLRMRILEKLIAEGSGATGSYPTPLNELPKLREVLADDREYENAKKIAASIVTLPVHSGVDVTDRENIKRIIQQVIHAN